MSSGLPLRIRLHRAFLMGLVLAVWAYPKVWWEISLEAQQDALRYHNIVITRELRDQMSQGMAIGLLGGLRPVVADFSWLQVTQSWMDHDWFHLNKYVQLTTTLQPRNAIYWAEGGQHLAWDASYEQLNNQQEPNPYRRMRLFRFWVEEGRKLMVRGLENNPQSFEIWNRLGTLNFKLLQNFDQAAYCYQKAAECPQSPIYIERFPAYMYEQGGNDSAAYEAWKKLWFRFTPEDKKNPQHWADRVEERIKKLENKLSIPSEKRVFPN